MTFTPRRLKWTLNLYPPFRFAGVRVRRVSNDWRELDVEMRLRWYNRNAVGTHFGGSLYSMTDPHLMLMLMQILGRDYVVWDQAATIRFLNPGRGTVHCAVRIGDDMLNEIRAQTADGDAFRPEFALEVVDEGGGIVASISKTLYVRRKSQTQWREGDDA